MRVMEKENGRAAIACADAKTRQRRTKTLDDLMQHATMLASSGILPGFKIGTNGEPQIDRSGCAKAGTLTWQTK